MTKKGKHKKKHIKNSSRHKVKEEHYKPVKKQSMFLWLAFVLLVTIISFSNTFDNELTNWDDDRYVNKNSVIRDISAENLKSIFWGDKRFYMGNYHPVTMLSLAIDFQLSDTQEINEDIEYKVEPFPFHLTNLLLHLITTVLVFYFVYLIASHLKSRWAFEISIIVAFLFALHPMHVESVTWISERKDVLYSAFFSGSLVSYVIYLNRNSTKYFILSLVLFILSLLSKGQAVSLALSLIGVDFVYGRKLLHKKVLLEKAPYFALALAFGIIAVIAQQEGEAIRKHEEFTLFERMIYASYGFIMYLVKLSVPQGFSAIYPYQYPSGSIPAGMYLFLLAPVAVIFVFAKAIKRNKLVAFGLFFFVVNIIFLLQLIPVGNSFMADRYVYIPSIGFFIIIGAIYAYLVKRNYRLRPLLLGILGIFIAILAYKTYQRNDVWQNSLTLWNDVIEKQSKATVAYNNRGGIKNGRNNFKGALKDYSKAIYLDSTYTHAYYNRGTVKKDWANESGKKQLFKQAINDFNTAIEQNPDLAEAYHNRGLCYDKLGYPKQALKDFNTAIEKNVDDYKIYVNRGVVKGKLGKFNEALEDFNTALSINPESPDAYSNKGLAYSNLEKYQKALKNYNRAIALKQDNENAFYNRGLLLVQMEKYEQAIDDFSSVLNINSENPSAYYQRALVYRRINQRSKACQDLQSAIKLGYSPARKLFQRYCK